MGRLKTRILSKIIIMGRWCFNWFINWFVTLAFGRIVNSLNRLTSYLRFMAAWVLYYWFILTWVGVNSHSLLMILLKPLIGFCLSCAGQKDEYATMVTACWFGVYDIIHDWYCCYHMVHITSVSNVLLNFVLISHYVSPARCLFVLVVLQRWFVLYPSCDSEWQVLLE